MSSAAPRQLRSDPLIGWLVLACALVACGDNRRAVRVMMEIGEVPPAYGTPRAAAADRPRPEAKRPALAEPFWEV